MKLVLFDIDGTLLNSDGAGRRAVHRALIEVFGTTGPEGYRFDGKTDPQIVRELMLMAGIDETLIARRMDELLDRYVGYLHDELATPGYQPRALPGVHALLDALETRADVILGLLTGNVREGAGAKLRAVDIDPARFRVGAFGSDHHHRPELPAVARDRTRHALGVDVSGDAMIVIGDTPADLTCGQSLGARAIGVATGHYSADDLLAYEPFAVFPDFSDTDRVVRVIVNGDGEGITR